MTTCLVLGGNGFLGSHIVDRLVENDYNVRVFDNFKFGTDNLKNVSNKIEIFKGDFLDTATLKKSLKDVDYVFHYIGLTLPQESIKDPKYDLKNISYSLDLLKEVTNAGVKKIIFPSSGGTVYGEPIKLPVSEDHPTNPIVPYGITKLAIEKYLYLFSKLYGLDYIILRYSNPYGERQNPRGIVGAVTIFLNLIKEGKPLTVFGDGSIVRDYVYVKDVSEVNLLVIKKNVKNQIFNIGTGIGTSINELIKTISEVIDRKPQVAYINSRSGDVSKIILDISKARKELGWNPSVPLKEGIKKTWLWLQKLD